MDKEEFSFRARLFGIAGMIITLGLAAEHEAYKKLLRVTPIEISVEEDRTPPDKNFNLADYPLCMYKCNNLDLGDKIVSFDVDLKEENISSTLIVKYKGLLGDKYIYVNKGDKIEFDTLYINGNKFNQRNWRKDFSQLEYRSILEEIATAKSLNQ